MSFIPDGHPQALLLQRLADAFYQIPFNRMLCLQLESLTPQKTCLSFTLKNELIGNFKQHILHGGVIASALDMAGGMAIMAALIEQQAEKSLAELKNVLSKTSTISLNVDYLRPGKGEIFYAKARVIQLGNRIGFTQMRLITHTAQRIANATATYSF